MTSSYMDYSTLESAKKWVITLPGPADENKRLRRSPGELGTKEALQAACNRAVL